MFQTWPLRGAETRKWPNAPRRNGLARHQTHLVELRAIRGGERFDLPAVAAIAKRPPPIRDAGLEVDAAVAQDARLALETDQATALVSEPGRRAGSSYRNSPHGIRTDQPA